MVYHDYDFWVGLWLGTSHALQLNLNLLKFGSLTVDAERFFAPARQVPRSLSLL